MRSKTANRGCEGGRLWYTGIPVYQSALTPLRDATN